MESIVEQKCDECVVEFIKDIIKKYPELDYYELFSVYKWGSFHDHTIRNIDDKLYVISETDEKIVELDKQCNFKRCV